MPPNPGTLAPWATGVPVSCPKSARERSKHKLIVRTLIVFTVIRSLKYSVSSLRIHIARLPCRQRNIEILAAYGSHDPITVLIVHIGCALNHLRMPGCRIGKDP